MKQKKYHLKALISALALMLTLAGPVFLGAGPRDDGTVPPSPKFPPVEEEIPEAEENDGIQPLIDKDDPTTKIEA